MFYKLKKGFTLVEMLVVVAVMGLLAAAMTANYRAGERNKNLSGAVQEMVNVLHRAQSSAMAGQTYNGSPTSGFLVTLDSNFTNNSNTRYRVCAVLPSDANYLNCVNNRPVDEIQLPRGVVIDRVRDSGQACGGGQEKRLDIFYSVPYGDITSYGTLVGGSTYNNSTCLLTVVLLNTQSNRTTEITIYPVSGRVENN